MSRGYNKYNSNYNNYNTNKSNQYNSNNYQRYRKKYNNPNDNQQQSQMQQSVSSQKINSNRFSRPNDYTPPPPRPTRTPDQYNQRGGYNNNNNVNINRQYHRSRRGRPGGYGGYGGYDGFQRRGGYGYGGGRGGYSGYKRRGGYGGYQKPIEYQFPNDWVDASVNPNDIYWRKNYSGWSAVKPLPRYFTKCKDDYPYPDRKPIPHYAKKGDIKEITDVGCKFIIEQYQKHESLLPGSITLVKFAAKGNKSMLSKNRPSSGTTGSQIRIHYSWLKYFQILWANAKENNVHVEIPEMGWKLSAIEKYESSIKRNIAKSIATALDKQLISIGYTQKFYSLSDSLDKYIKKHLDKFEKTQYNDDLSVKKINITPTADGMNDNNPNNQTINSHNINLNNTFDEDEKEEINNPKFEMIRNQEEFMQHLKKNGFGCVNDETRFEKIISYNILSANILSDALLNTFSLMCQLSELVEYEWRIGIDIDTTLKILTVWIEPWANGLNQFDLYVSLRQLDYDASGTEGDDHTDDEIQKEFAKAHLDKMYTIYTKIKKSIISLSSENEWKKNIKILKSLKNNINFLAITKYSNNYNNNSTPPCRPQKYKNAWDSCCGFNYPGKNILNKINNMNKLIKMMTKHTINIDPPVPPVPPTNNNNNNNNNKKITKSTK